MSFLRTLGSWWQWLLGVLLRLAPFLVAWLVAAPVLLVLLRAIELPLGKSGRRWVETGQIWEWFEVTCWLVALVMVVATLFGVVTAWLVARARFVGRGLLAVLLVLPLAIPSSMAAVAYLEVKESLIPFFVWVRENRGIEDFLLVQDLVSWLLAVMVLAGTLYPYVYLGSLAAFLNLAAAPMEAARMMGAGRLRLFFGIALPLARPAIIAGAFLVALEVMNDYGVSTFFGLDTLTTGIFRAWLTAGELETAIRLASMLLMVVAVLWLLEWLQRGRFQLDEDGESGETMVSRRLGWMGSFWSWLLCLPTLSIGLLYPLWRLGRWAWLSRETVDWVALREAAWMSIWSALLVAALAVVGGLLVCLPARAWRSWGWRLPKGLASMGYMMPSALIAVGVVAMVSMMVNWNGWSWVALSASVFGLAWACFCRFEAVAVQSLGGALGRLPRSLHETSRSLGFGPVGSLWRVDVPLVRGGMLVAFGLVALDMLKELTMTLVLSPFGFQTLATLAFGTASEGRIPQAAAPSLALMVIGLVVLIPLVGALLRKRA